MRPDLPILKQNNIPPLPGSDEVNQTALRKRREHRVNRRLASRFLETQRGKETGKHRCQSKPPKKTPPIEAKTSDAHGAVPKAVFYFATTFEAAVTYSEGRIPSQ